jgi:predicted permease
VGRLLSSLAFRLRRLLARSRAEDEMDEELRGHLARQIEANERAGMSPAEARRSAALAFGSVESLKEECRESWGVHVLDTVLQDARFAIRGLRRNPGYAAVVVLTLGLGIGANTAIFSVVNGILLRPLPWAEGDRIVALRHDTPNTNASDIGFSVPEVRDLGRLSQSLDAVAEYHQMNFTLLGGAEPLRVRTGVVSAGFFDMLGVSPVLGRGFRPEDEAHWADAVLLVSHAYWVRAFGGDPGIVGRVFEMNEKPHRVIGVLPPLPAFPGEDDVYMPATACPFRERAAGSGSRQARMLAVYGRLRRGVGVESARAELTALLQGLAGQHRDAYAPGASPAVAAEPARELMIRAARPTFLVLLATVGLVLLIACANVANLALARLLGRGKELAVRAALGAGRGRLLRQLLTESAILSLAGGAVGLLFAAATQGALVRFAALFTPRASDVQLDGPVLVFTLALSFLSGLVFGTLPGLPSAEQLSRAAASDDGRLTPGPRRERIRSALVVAQVATSFTLVIGAALLLRSFAKLRAVDAGFRVENVVAVPIDVNWSRFLGPERRTDVARLAAFHDAFFERLAARPGVVHVGAAYTFPLNSQFRNDGVIVVAGAAEGSAGSRVEFMGATPDYFRALGVPLLAGRFLTADDRGAADAVLVNESLARREFGGAALGRRLSLDGGATWRSVVGVVGDIRQGALAEEPRPTVFLPFAQFPGFSASLIVRGSLPPPVLLAAIRDAARALAPDTAIGSPRTLEEIRADSIASPRLTALLLGLFAALALAIAAAGISGVLAYSVSQRTREIGVRVALGASPRDVLGLVMAQGLRPLFLGLGLGMLAALGLSRLVSRMLFGIEPTDPLCFAGSLLVLLGVGIAACLVPARRAVALPPIGALRAA